MHIMLLLLAVSCYGLPVKDQKKGLCRPQSGQNEIYQAAIYQMNKPFTTETYSHIGNQAKNLDLLADNVFQSNTKSYGDSGLTLGKRESDQGLNDQQKFNEEGIGSNKQPQKSLDETVWQDHFNDTRSTKSILNLIFQNIIQGSNDEKLRINSTDTDVNTENYGRSNDKKPPKKEIAPNDQTYEPSHEELMQDKINSVNKSNPVSQSELIKLVFGSSPGFKNDNSSEKRKQEDIARNENEINIKSNFLKEVFGKNWDIENKPLNRENLDLISKITLGSSSPHNTDKTIANNHNGEKRIEQVLRDYFGNSWDTENKPIGQVSSHKYLNLFGSYSKADTILDHGVEDEHSDQDTLLLENKHSQNGWLNDYNLGYLLSDYPWTIHSSQGDVKRDKQDYFGNIDSQYFQRNALQPAFCNVD